MIFKNTLYLLLLSLGVLAGQKAFSMETPLLPELKVEDYVETRDLSDIDAIFRSDWNKLEASRSYNNNLVVELFEAWPHAGATTKYRKVLRHKDKTIGFIIYYHNSDNKRGYCEVGGIAPEYRRQGLAKHFLGKVIEQLKENGATHIEIFCKKDNQISKGLYDKLGFEMISDKEFKGIAYLLRKNI